MRLRLAELQELDAQFQKIREEKLKKGWEDVDRVLQHQTLLFVFETIQTELISRYYNDHLGSHFGINKTREFIGQKYYWPNLKRDVEVYVKGCDIYLALKAIKYKLYGDL